MLKFLVDENVGNSIVLYLREQGLDTISVTELFPSRDDNFIMEKAYQEKRILVTNDKDFGYLFFKSDLPAYAIILFRFRDESPALKIKAIEAVLKLPRDKVLNHYIVVSENKIRIRTLEKPALSDER